MQSELRRRTLGEQIGLTFSLSADLFGPLFIITVVCALPGLVIQLTLMPDINAMQVGASMPMLMEQLESALIALGAALAQMLVTIPILEAAIAVIIRATYVGERPSVVAGFKLAMRRFGGMFLLKLGLSVILTLGFMLCLAPYFLFAAWFFVATPVLLFENRSWLDALPRARSLADGYTVEMLALFLLLSLSRVTFSVAAQPEESTAPHLFTAPDVYRDSGDNWVKPAAEWQYMPPHEAHHSESAHH